MAGGADPRKLRRLGQDFAERLTRILNATVCNGSRLSAAGRADGSVIVGCGVTPKRLFAQSIPLAVAGKPSAWLKVFYALRWDTVGDYMAVVHSSLTVAADPGMSEIAMRYEYERASADDYPEAHIHVHGRCPALATIRKRRSAEADDSLERVHLPVGGRRFRPTLEDVIEMLIVEGFAEGRTGWKAAIAEGRREWEGLELAAAVRRDPETAREALARLHSS